MDKMIIKKIKGLFLMTNPKYHDIFVDDMKVMEHEIVTTNTEPKRIHFKKENEKKSHYEREDGIIISIEDWENKRRECFIDDSYDCDDFRSLEHKIEWLRFTDGIKLIWDTIITEEEIEFEILDYPDSDNEFIIPYRLLSTKERNEALYSYLPDVVKMLEIVSKRYGFVGVSEEIGTDHTHGKKYDIPSRNNGIEYCSVNGKYRFTNVDKRNIARGISAGTYDECEKRYNRDIEFLDNVFKTADAEIRDMNIEYIGVKKLLEDLNIIERYAEQIDPKKSSYSSYRQMMNKIRELEKEIINSSD